MKTFEIVTIVLCWIVMIADFVMVFLLNAARRSYEDADNEPSSQSVDIRPVVYVDADTGRRFLVARTLTTWDFLSSTCQASYAEDSAYWLDELPTREASSANFLFVKERMGAGNDSLCEKQ